MRTSNVSVVSECSLVKGLFSENNLTTRARAREGRILTPTEKRKLLHTVERHLFQDGLRHKATRQGRFDAAMWHLDHPLPGGTRILLPSDRGSGAERIYAAVENVPLWLRLWRRQRLALKPRHRTVLDALMVDWRSRPAAKIAGISQPTVDLCKKIFKVHFAQCWQAYKRDFDH